ncbi:tetratricopeptide repeat protein [Spirochaeta africana]|uniref:Tetratricopeptide repeat protein n=1 Tax=Spirochaeta africana (strain ATCC 700263 / DSM 8902 / Z-7692) TaxID=889378 RepID=H9UM19_SPIAZ|nr:tetratricopeptide repeat protein [Spirochaeta africana]AFG38562.1 tetratricopeptide repeat protein [Spirochaeta africana DSM 8902]
MRITTVLLASVVLLSSCALGEPHLSVFQGNYAFGRGDFQAATVSYLRALSHDSHTDIIQYNLGNVYHALGEADAATDAWETALTAESTEVQFAVHFNRGVLMYESGRYQESYRAFRDAVRINPRSVDAKLNLELAYERMSSTSAVRGDTAESASAPSRELGAEDRRILEFIRRREVQSWDRPQQNEAPVLDW